MSYKKIVHKGQGGFGIVDVVENSKGEKFARKTFHFNHPNGNAVLIQNATKRFIHEAKIQDQFDHKNIVKVIELLLSNDPPAYIMNLAEASMAEDIESGYLNPSNYMDCLSDIMSGLEAMHQVAICHRDLKPGNILRFKDPKGGRDFYAIGDFGLMSIQQTNFTTLTHTGMGKGTDMYTAPEITQDLKRATVQSDIYSLGCLLHDFVGENTRIPCSEIRESTPFSNILLFSTKKESTKRFKNVSTFRESLADLSTVKVLPKSERAQQIVDAFEKDLENYSLKDITLLGDFLSSTTNEADKKIIFRWLTGNHIEIINQYPEQAGFIGKEYANYVRDNSFDFEFCDSVCIRMRRFIEKGDIELKAEGIMALVIMGSQHNRYYVERHAASYLKGDIEDNLLKRLCMEIKVSGRFFCEKFRHLRSSINYELSDFHPEIIKATKDSCKEK